MFLHMNFITPKVPINSTMRRIKFSWEYVEKLYGNQPRSPSPDRILSRDDTRTSLSQIRRTPPQLDDNDLDLMDNF